MNPCGFVGNNPLNAVDILGLSSSERWLMRQLTGVKERICEEWQRLIDLMKEKVNRENGSVDLSKGWTFAWGDYGEIDLGARVAVSSQKTLSFPKGGGFLDVRFGTAISKPVLFANGITDAGIGVGKNFSISPVGSPDAWNGRSLEAGSNIQPVPIPPFNLISLGLNGGNMPIEGSEYPAPVVTFSYGLNAGLFSTDWYAGLSDTDARSYSIRDFAKPALEREQRNHDEHCKCK